LRKRAISGWKLARNLAMSPSAVSYAVERGEVIAIDNNYQPADY
jgi:hypothetical protein